MADLREDLERLARSADRIPAPDLWGRIERQEPGRPPPAAGSGHRVLTLVVAMLVAAAGITGAIRIFSGRATIGEVALPTERSVAFLRPSSDGTSSLVIVTNGSAGPRTKVLATGVPTGPSAAGMPAGSLGFPFAWSPDGSRIAVASSGGIEAVDVAGGRTTRLTDRAGDAGPAWAPDGSTIAFVRAGGGGGLFVVPAGGGEARSVCPTTACGEGIAQPAWSPDGATILFSHAGVLATGATSPTSTIDVVAADGSGHRRLTDCGDVGCPIDVAPSWSRDGSTILYDHGAGQGGGQKFMELALGARKPVVVSNCPVPLCLAGTAAVWSPDGSRFAYPAQRDLNGGSPFVVVAGSGGPVVHVSTCAGSACVAPMSVAWSSDGRSLLFVGGLQGDPSSVTGLYLVPADGGGSPGRVLAAAGACCAAWQPIG